MTEDEVLAELQKGIKTARYVFSETKDTTDPEVLSAHKELIIHMMSVNYERLCRRVIEDHVKAK